WPTVLPIMLYALCPSVRNARGERSTGYPRGGGVRHPPASRVQEGGLFPFSQGALVTGAAGVQPFFVGSGVGFHNESPFAYTGTQAEHSPPWRGFCTRR